MNTRFFEKLLLAWFVLGSFAAFAQELPADSIARYYDMSLEDLQKLKSSGVSSELEKLINNLLSVASQKGMTSRESPGIVTLITSEEIRKSGARDLIDVLRLVPGFDFAYDGESSIGLGVRGNWTSDGKLLFLVDGQQVNEIFKGSVSFGNHFPISTISRIEIIRGPGSAIYGGFATLGVINIITDSGAEINGARVTGTYGTTSTTSLRRNIEFGIGKKFKELSLSLSGIAGAGTRSDRESFIPDLRNFGNATAINGRLTSLAGQSKDDPFMLNFKGSYRNLHFGTILDRYRSTVLQIGDQTGERPITRRNNSLNADLYYDWKLNDKLTITPRFSLINQVPAIEGLPDSLIVVEDYGTRVKGGATLSYNPVRRLNLIVGAEYYRDETTNSEDSIFTVNGAVSSISYENYAAFVQAVFKHRIANITVGGRYDDNTSYGDAFVPRIGVTRRFEKMHGKILYSQSFRAPTFQNIARGVNNFNEFLPGIKPEKTTVVELEVGYQMTKDQIVTVNLFDAEVRDPIVYNSTIMLYTNYERSGSRGFEVEYRLKKPAFSLTSNYSFYSVNGKPKVDSYKTTEFTPGDVFFPSGPERDSRLVLAFPAHKVTLNTIADVAKNVSISATGLLYSTRYGYDLTQAGTDNVYSTQLKKFDPSFLLHAFVNFNRLLGNLDASVGVYNAFNERYSFLAPSYTNYGSLPAANREFLVRLSYNINAK